MWPKIFLRNTGTGKMLTFPPFFLPLNPCHSCPPIPPGCSGVSPLYYFLLFCILFSTCLWTLLPSLRKKDQEVSLPLSSPTPWPWGPNFLGLCETNKPLPPPLFLMPPGHPGERIWGKVWEIRRFGHQEGSNQTKPNQTKPNQTKLN